MAEAFTQAFLDNLLVVVARGGADGIEVPIGKARGASASLSRRGLVHYRRDVMPWTGRGGARRCNVRVVITEKGRAAVAKAASAPEAAVDAA